MPSRITVDENGFIVSVQSIPAVKSTDLPSSKKRRQKKRGRSSSPTTTQSVSSGYLRFDGRSWTRCPVCKARLLEKNLVKHQRKVHRIEEPSRHGDAQARGKENVVGSVKKSKGRKTTLPSSAGGRRTGTTHKPMDLHEQGVRQSFEDQHFSGRGLGHFRREEGRFGSLPLYDDYGEESDP
jgi:hypothetical protein